MNKQKRVLQVTAIGLCVVMLCVAAYTGQREVIQIEDEVCALGDAAGVLIEQMQDDLTVIPDKYNTGAKGELMTVQAGANVNGIQFKSASNGTRNALDFAYGNKSVAGTVSFENYDFSDAEIWSYNEDKVDRSIKVIFTNCAFSKVAVGKEKGNLSFEFNNCTIESFSGSNAVFNQCQFGKSHVDGLVPYQNVEVNDCFFSDMAGKEVSSKSVHTDATQIYGIAGIDVQNVFYNNCRFEVPPLSLEGSAATINACIMLQLEFSNAKNVSFTDCIVNGGGYSLYAWDKNKGYTFENVSFNNIKTGCARSFGTIYGTVDPAIKMQNISETESLYIASVWRENGKTHFSVSNDTNQERTLTIYTDKGTFEYVIPACPKGEEMTSAMTYCDMPFDLDITVPTECEYAVCYDNTLEGCGKQIRFLNWSGKSVCLDKEIVSAMTSGADDVIFSGECGKNVNFTLSKSGVLTLSGQGATYGYHSAKLPPWTDYISSIKEIRIEEGIETLGGQLFSKCSAVQTVVLPESLTKIDKRVFSGCSSLTAITMPAGVEAIGDAAFSGSVLQTIHYEGDNWNAIELGTGNENLAEKVVYVEEVLEEPIRIIAQGGCGKQADYVLTEDGVLTISGTGDTYNYHSAKVAPWFEYRELIKTIVVEAGIEKIGEQLFRKCSNVETVELPNSIKIIGKSAFNSCKNLNNIVIPGAVNEIQSYAFAGVNNLSTIYEGTALEWEQIQISAGNMNLLRNISYQ